MNVIFTLFLRYFYWTNSNNYYFCGKITYYVTIDSNGPRGLFVRYVFIAKQHFIKLLSLCCLTPKPQQKIYRKFIKIKLYEQLQHYCVESAIYVFKNNLVNSTCWVVRRTSSLRQYFCRTKSFLIKIAHKSSTFINI